MNKLIIQGRTKPSGYGHPYFAAAIGAPSYINAAAASAIQAQQTQRRVVLQQSRQRRRRAGAVAASRALATRQRIRRRLMLPLRPPPPWARARLRIGVRSGAPAQDPTSYDQFAPPSSFSADAPLEDAADEMLPPPGMSPAAKIALAILGIVVVGGGAYMLGSGKKRK